MLNLPIAKFASAKFAKFAFTTPFAKFAIEYCNLRLPKTVKCIFFKMTGDENDDDGEEFESLKARAS